MAIVMTEANKSGAFAVDGSGGKKSELLYFLTGSDSEAAIYAHVVANSPSTHPDWGTPRKGIDCQPEDGNAVWRIKVTYETPRFGSVAVITPGTEEIEYDTTGGTTRIMTSLATVVADAPTGMDVPLQHGLINVSTDGRSEGVDIVSPRLSMRVTKTFASGDVDTAYIALLAMMSGSTNDATWRGFAVGEVLFVGASARRNNADGSWTIVFNFQMSPNESVAIDDIPAVAKAGWHYLWVYSEPEEDATAKRITGKPRAVYVEQVYRETDFSDLGISTT